MTIQSYLENICLHVGLEQGSFTITVDESDEDIKVQIDVPQEDVGAFIGHRGETLTSIQRLVRVVFQSRESQDDSKRITININDYREEREEALKEKAAFAVQRVLDQGRPYVFSNLSSYERFIVHSAVSEASDEVVSESEGQGSGRRLVVKKK